VTPLLESGAANDNAFQYTGRENDGTGLYYYRARYYDPETGRFISQDPIGFAGGINQYAYVGGNPISFVDPYGLNSIAVPRLPAIPSLPAWAGPAAAVAGAAWGGWKIGTAIYDRWGDDIQSWIPDPKIAEGLPPGAWPGDRGAEEWGRRNGCGAKEGKRRFHKTKQGDPTSRPTDKYGVDPSNGNVYDPEGEVIGNLDE
jgi:RHS repeat-associated protein